MKRYPPKRARLLYETLKKLNLPKDKIIVAGSAPLYAYGILHDDSPTDLDVIVKNRMTWHPARLLGQMESVRSQGFHGDRPESMLIKYDCNDDGREEIEFTQSWPMAGRDFTALFNDSIMIDGVRYMSLRDVIVTKRVLDRPKDREHLRLVKEWYKAQKKDGCQKSDFDKELMRAAEQGFAAKLPKPDND